MSIVPMMFRDWWDEWDRPSRLLDQHFGVGLRRDDLFSSFPSSPFLRNSYFRPWRTNLGRQESSSTLNLTKDKFETVASEMRERADALRRSMRERVRQRMERMQKVILDVQQFAPEEISVKATNNCVVVEGKHEEKQDEHGFISRQFTRKYILPGGYDVADVISTLSSDGVLTITAPKKPPPNAGERNIPIMRTGPAKQPEPPKPQTQEQPSYQSKPQEQPNYQSNDHFNQQKNENKYQPQEHTVPIVTSP